MSIFAMRVEENGVARRDFMCDLTAPAASRYWLRSAARSQFDGELSHLSTADLE
jgi:hypothetical protein